MTYNATGIVVPCYNEEKRLDSDQFSRFLATNGDVKFHFVNDGSSDGTIEVLHRLIERHGCQVGVLDLPQNRGKAEAVRRGVLELLGDKIEYVGYWDADLATPLDAIVTLRELLTNDPDLQAVFGSRVQLLGRQIDRKAARHYAGRIFATVISMLLKLKVYDTQCGAKLFRANRNTTELFLEPFKSKWIFDVEILMRLVALETGESQSASCGVYEYPLKQWCDVGGSNIRLVDFALAARDLWKIYRDLSKRSVAKSE